MHLNKRLIRLALKLQGMALDIQYHPGKENSNANVLSKKGWEDDVPVESRPGVCQMHPMGAVLAGGKGEGLISTEEKIKTQTELIDSQFLYMTVYMHISVILVSYS